jgi:hypothetical protein
LTSSVLAGIAALSLAVRIEAQIPVPTQPPTPAPVSASSALLDSIAAFERPNGGLLRAGTSTYQLSLTKPDGVAVPLGVQTITVTDSPLSGAAGWLIADSRVGTMVATSDSVFLSRGTLTPERWTAVNGRAQLGAAFTRDTAFGGIQNYQGRASFAIGVPGDVLLSAGMTTRIIEMLPLREGYRVRATLFVVDGLTPMLTPAEISVDSVERIPVGGRLVDAWRVVLRAGAMERRYWVSRDGARVVRIEVPVPEGLMISTLAP